MSPLRSDRNTTSAAGELATSHSVVQQALLSVPARDKTAPDSYLRLYMNT